MSEVSDQEYELIVSPRAKRASLRVVPGRGLVVTIPKRFPRKSVAELLASQRQWIETSLAEVRAQTPACFLEWPPKHLHLSAMGTNVELIYPNEDLGGDDCVISGATVTCTTPAANQLTVLASTDDKPAVAKEISTHLKRMARHFLTPRLASHAQLHGKTYAKASIRGQRTVWGSYSSSGTLSLNYKLLFLRPELVDYVLLHELAHTVHLDHSVQFWRLLSSMNVNARALDKELRRSGRLVPPWLELRS